MQRKILLLEEDATYAGDIRRGLSNLGFEVTLLRDGREGLARAVSEPFDLILLSAELPAINGFRICNRVKKDPNVGNVPLFLMGSTKQELVTHGQLPTRADDYFTKPIVFDELVARMRLLGLVGGAVELNGIAQARDSLSAVAELESKVAEQEATIASLHGELSKARAVTTRLDAQAKELDRLRAALAEAKRIAKATEPASSAPGEMREQQARALTLAERALETEKTAAVGVRSKLATAEASLRSLETRAREDERVIAKQKKQLEGHAADKELARKRIEHLTERLARVKPDLDKMRDEVTAAQSEAAASQAAGARALEVEREAWAAVRTEMERGLEQASARIAKLTEELTAARARAEADAADRTDRIDRLEAAEAEKAAEVERLTEALAHERGAHAATRARAGAVDADLTRARTAETERSTRIASLEQALADLADRSASAEVKRAEVARSLSDATRRTSALEEERARLLERCASAEEAASRAEIQVADVRTEAAESSEQARREAEQAQRDAIAEVVAKEAERLRTTEQNLTRAHEQRSAALVADYEARLAEERRRAEEEIARARAEVETVAAENAEGELSAMRELYETRFGGLRNDLDAARAEATRQQARVRELEERASLEASSRSEAERALAEARTATQASHERALAELRKELDVARGAAGAATKRARELETALGGETGLLREARAHVEALEADLAAAKGLGEAAETRARDAEARIAEATRMSAQAAATMRAELTALRTELEEQLREQAARRASTEERCADLERVVSERARRVMELEVSLAEAHDAVAAFDTTERSLAEAETKIATLERTLRELEDQRRWESLETAREHETAMGVLRELLNNANAEKESMLVHFDDIRACERADLEAEWERRLAEAVEGARDASALEHAAEMDALIQHSARIELERVEIQAGFEAASKDLESALDRTREALEAERLAHAASRAASARRIDALDALVASRRDAIDALEREVDEACSEIPELEAEIVVLRSELLTVRRQLDAHVLGARVAGAELERHRDVLARAEQLLDGGAAFSSD